MNEYQEKLEGKRVELWYLKKPNSLGWKKASVIMLSYSDVAYQHGLALKNQEGWYAVKWVEYQVRQ